MLQKIKQNIGGVILGAVIVATAWLGYVFYKNIVLLNSVNARLNGVIQWGCSKDPASCVGADGKPLQTNEPAPAPAPTTEAPAAGRTK